MNFYLSPYVQTASTIPNDGLIWQPAASQQAGGGWIDLTPQGSLPTMALLALPIHDPDPRLRQIGADILDPVKAGVKTVLANQLGYTDPLTGTVVKDIIGQLLRQPPTNRWRALRPLRSGISEVWIAGQQVWHNAPAGGSGGLGGTTIGVEDILVHAADFSSRKRFHESVIDLLGYLPLVAMGVLTYRHPEVAGFALMALPKTETFTGTDGTNLNVYDTNWDDVHRNAFIRGTGTTCGPDGSTGPGTDGNVDVIVQWSGDTFSNDQYAVGTCAVVTGTSNYVGVSVRDSGLDTTAYGYYCFFRGTYDTYLRKYINGTRSVIHDAMSDATGWATSDLARLEAEGSTLRFTRNGTHMGTSPYTDTSITSGSAGVGGFGGGATWATISALEMGNLGSATVKRFFMTMGVGT